MKKLTLIRGLPGSGKSTRAKELCAQTGAEHIETDMFFTDLAGNYNYDPDLVSTAHRWCLARTKALLGQSDSVVVSNTFTRRWEIEPYVELIENYFPDDCQIEIITCTGRYQNVHGVPAEVIERMRERWEEVTLESFA